MVLFWSKRSEDDLPTVYHISPATYCHAFTSEANKETNKESFDFMKAKIT